MFAAGPSDAGTQCGSLAGAARPARRGPPVAQRPAQQTGRGEPAAATMRCALMPRQAAARREYPSTWASHRSISSTEKPLRCA